MIIRLSAVLALLLALNLLVPVAAAPAAKTLMVKAPPVKLEAVASALPIWFEPNRGQVGGRTEWTARAAGVGMFLTSNEVVYALPPGVKFVPAKTRGVPSLKTKNVHMRIVGGQRVNGFGEGAMEGYSNYFVGKHEDEWFTGVPHFERVRYRDVYRGIDLVYYSAGRSVEYDFLVGPLADPSTIELAFDGAEGLRLDEDGDLVVSVGGKSFRQRRPRVFQGSEEIETSYRMTERGTVKLNIGDYNPLISLRVDPILDFATYLGGPGEDSISSIVVAPDGNPVLAGTTQSPQSPTLDPFMQPNIVSWAPIILKMSTDGRRVLAYTILGRNGGDGAAALAVDRSGSIIVGGTTRSSEFPLKNAFQTEFKAIWDNAFVTKLSPDLRTLIYSSYMGGSNREALYTVTLDEQGNAYFGGGTQSLDYPTVSPIQGRHEGGGHDWFISKISTSGALQTSTFLGGDGGDVLTGLQWRPDGALIAVGMSTNANFPLKDPIQTNPAARVGQTHPIMAIVSTVSNTLLYSTYFADGATGWADKVAVDAEGLIYVTGASGAGPFPIKNPLFGDRAEASGNGFLTQLRPDGKMILFSTYLPGASPGSVAVDAAGNIYISGVGFSALPLVNSLQDFQGGGVLNGDHFIMKLAPGAKSVLYSTLIGGRGNELGIKIVPSTAGSIYFGGVTGSSDYPNRAAYQTGSGGSTDGVFGRIVDNSNPSAPAVFVTPANLVFRFVQNGAIPDAATVTVDSQGLTGAIRTSQSWLRVTPGGLTSSGKLQISVDPSGLSPGTYRGNIAVTPASGAPGVVEVSLLVLAEAPLLVEVQPARIEIGAGDTDITLRGSGFTTRLVVFVESVKWELSPIQIINPSTLKFKMPKAYFSGEYNFSITVQNPDSAISKAIPLSVGRPGPAINGEGIVSAASFEGKVVSPGEIVTIFGQNFEAGMTVMIDGITSVPIYITPQQLSVTVPYGVSGSRETTFVVEASPDRRSVPVRIPVWPARPGLFTANSSGKGLGAILNQDGSVNSDVNPATRGSVIVLYATGGGTLTGHLLASPVRAFIDGMETEVLYAGVAPGLVTGAIQVNVRVPEFALRGEVVLRVGDRESQSGVIVALR